MSQQYEEMRNKSIAKIIISEETYQIRKLIWDGNSFSRHDYGKKRRGGPIISPGVRPDIAPGAGNTAPGQTRSCPGAGLTEGREGRSQEVVNQKVSLERDKRIMRDG